MPPNTPGSDTWAQGKPTRFSQILGTRLELTGSLCDPESEQITFHCRAEAQRAQTLGQKEQGQQCFIESLSGTWRSGPCVKRPKPSVAPTLSFPLGPLHPAHPTHCWFRLTFWECKSMALRLSTIFLKCCLSFHSSDSASCSLAFSKRFGNIS